MDLRPLSDRLRRATRPLTWAFPFVQRLLPTARPAHPWRHRCACLRTVA